MNDKIHAYILLVNITVDEFGVRCILNKIGKSWPESRITRDRSTKATLEAKIGVHTKNELIQPTEWLLDIVRNE